MPYKIDESVLLATARVHAALQLLPRIVGPRDIWMPWMHANLAAEVKKVKGTSLPHPRLLGSLQRVLARSYAEGLAIDMVRFDEVCTDDPSIVGSDYVDVPAYALPKLKGADFSWWKGLPPSVILSPPPLPSSNVPSFVETASSKDQDQVSRPRVRLTFKLPAPASRKNVPKSKATDRPSNTGNTGTTQKAADPKGKKRATSEDTVPPPRKKKKFKSSEFVESEEEDDIQAGDPSTDSEASFQPEASEEPEASKVCDACKSRGSRCVWPSPIEPSQPQNERRACAACVSQKTRCNIAGIFSIRRPRGKAAASQQGVPPGKVHELTQLVTELSQRMADLEKKVSADNEEKQRLLSRVANLDHQLDRLRAKP